VRPAALGVEIAEVWVGYGCGCAGSGSAAAVGCVRTPAAEHVAYSERRTNTAGDDESGGGSSVTELRINKFSATDSTWRRPDPFGTWSSSGGDAHPAVGNDDRSHEIRCLFRGQKCYDLRDFAWLGGAADRRPAAVLGEEARSVFVYLVEDVDDHVAGPDGVDADSVFDDFEGQALESAG